MGTGLLLTSNNVAAENLFRQIGGPAERAIFSKMETLRKMEQETAVPTSSPPPKNIATFRKTMFKINERLQAIDTAKKELSELTSIYLSDIPDMDQVTRNNGNWDALLWVYMLPFPTFLAGMFITAHILRKRYIDPTTSDWHSRAARKIAAQIAALEPSDSPGLFANEIHRIHAAIFPIDLWLAWQYLRRAHWAIAEPRILSEESESVQVLRENLGAMFGKVIPNGDENILAIYRRTNT